MLRLCCCCPVRGVLLLVILASVGAAAADDPPSTAGPLLALLKRGTLPAERVPAVARMVCERGNVHDLAYIFEQASSDAWPPELRRDALRWLKEAAETRKLVPAGELTPLAALLADVSDPARLEAAIALAGTWRSPPAVQPLQALAENADVPAPLRLRARRALIAFGGDVARRTIDGMLVAGQPLEVRMQGVAGLVGLDPARAGGAAAALLRELPPDGDPAPIVDAFLNQRGGADVLAAALEREPPATDVALLALRHMYAVGRSDAALDAVLSRLAGVNAEAPRLSAAEVLELADLAVATGDAVRGEIVFRRGDLACLRCHAVNKGGGQIGPDLSPVGASSPVDYLVKSLYDPDAQKKEAYVTRIVLTAEGQQFTGIVETRTDEKVTLKLADGKLVEIPTADIEFESEGKSLMPEGLVKFMTRQEALDLVKFLSLLGRPETPYAIRQTQRMQRWRVLTGAAEHLLAAVPNDEQFGDDILRGGNWEPAYARVDGTLPLAELTARTRSQVLYVQGEFDVTAAGAVRLHLEPPAGFHVWINDDSLGDLAAPVVELPSGRHSVTLRIDAGEAEIESIRLQIERIPGSAAEFTVVDGA